MKLIVLDPERLRNLLPAYYLPTYYYYYYYDYYYDYDYDYDCCCCGRTQLHIFYAACLNSKSLIECIARLLEVVQVHLPRCLHACGWSLLSKARSSHCVVHCASK